MRTIMLLFLCNCLLAVSMLSQSKEKFPVEVIASGDDFVGGRLTYAVKEEIRKSSSMQLTMENRYRMTLRLVTVDSDKDYKGNATTYAVAWCITSPELSLPLYITMTVGYCGSQRVEEVAEGIVADTDKNISDLLREAARKTDAVTNRLSELEQLASRNPEDLKALLNVAHFAHDNRVYDKAITYYKKYLANNPKDADALVDFGICYNDLGKFDESRSYIEEALKYSPEHLLAHFNLGIVALRTGEKEKAIEWFKKAIAISPNSEVGQRAQRLIDLNESK